MVTRLRLSFVAALAACAIAVSAYAQDLSAASSPAPANLAHVEGAVDVVQDGVTERADPPVILIGGDLVRTYSGRAEIVFGDGTLLHLAPDSELELLGGEHLRLTSGRAIVRLSHAAARPYVIDMPAASVRLEAQGEYGITTDRGARLAVTVTRGSATVSDAATWTIGGGQQLELARPGARPVIHAFNSARWDPFAQWAHERTNGVAASRSASQLPYELRPYAPVLDHYGRWDYVAPHGYVWVPSVASSWRPYYDGSWSFTKYGWTWRGHERWAWPTHHYGRWGFNGAYWYWIPATEWAPAWVSWTVGAGYVAWAPLGWHSVWPRPDHPAYAPHYSPWQGWTVVRRDHFAPRRHVRVHAIDGNRLDEPTRRTLLGQAVTRSERVAVPRDEVVSPGSRGAVRRAPASDPLNRTGARAGDHPAYTPPAEWYAPERRGAVRDPSSRDTGASSTSVPSRAIPRDERPAAPPAAAPAPNGGARAIERGGPPAARVPPARGDRDPGSRSDEGSRGGAVRRGGGASERSSTSERGSASERGDAGERGGAAERGGAVPRGEGARAPARSDAPSPPPVAQGGARRRPGA